MRIEMEMEMEMRAKQDIELGQDITPPLLPLSFSLYDSFLNSHCSSCFSPLPSSPHNIRHVPLHCSTACSSFHSSIYSRSAESILPQSLPPTRPDSSDLRTALRLLHSLPSSSPYLRRCCGLLTNHHKLTSSPEFAAKIRHGAIAMAASRKLLNGGAQEQNEDFSLEEAVLSLVITNAVEVQDGSGRSLGIAVYEPSFSWINHSCSPNACYRFAISPPHATAFSEDSHLKIFPIVSGEEFNICRLVEYNKENLGYEYGPKIIVRSIKRINKGEEVCVSYTDLLQPKAMRHSELSFKYQFTCSCSRCSSSPSTYADRALEEISASNLSFSRSCFDLNLCRDEATKRLSEYAEETITEFLSVGDPDSCCENLESMLNLGLQYELLESKDRKSKLNFKLHSFHHISLNAYTTLASAYKIRSIELLALNSEVKEYQSKAFDMIRISAAYCLLLAGATHHLFLSEPSLIASAANFWTSAGESLLTLARSAYWNLIVKQQGLSIPELSTIAKHKSFQCSLMDFIDAKLILNQTHRANFETVCSSFLDCVSSMTPKIWRFLVRDCHYLQTIEDPIDFGWMGHTRFLNCHASRCDEDSKVVAEDPAEWCTNERRVSIYQLGVHCLAFGGILAQICYGQICYNYSRYEHLASCTQNFTSISETS